MAFYMPTGKERIEALQKQIRVDQNPVRSTAEIVVLRNMLKAERSKKGTLDKPIPTNGSLRGDVETLSKDPCFSYAARLNAVKNAATAGHGGGIVEKVYEWKAGQGPLLAQNNKPWVLSEAGDKILGANTRGGRVKELQKNAAEISNQLYDVPENQLPQVYEKAKIVIAEYLVHHDAMYDKYGLPKGDNEKNLRKPMPWSSVESRVQKVLELPKFQNMKPTIKNYCEALNTIIRSNFGAKPAEDEMEQEKDLNERQVNNVPDGPQP